MLLTAPMVMMAQEAQETDPVIMTINGKPVLRSEFQYSFNKNNGEDVIEHKTVEEYVDMFINYKLKVEAALDAHLDTLTSYLKEFRQYRDQQVRPTLITDADIENEARRIYQNTKDRIGPDGLVNPQHILIRVSQDADKSEQDAARLLADSIYNALVGGADFDKLASEKSQDPGSARQGGDISWISRGQTLKAFEEAAFALKDGELSKPVLSEVGYHIIRMKGHKQMEPYDTLRSDILAFMEKRNIRESLAAQRLKDIAAQLGKTEEEVMDMRSDSIAAIDTDMRFLIQEYHDGLLLYEICNREVWDKAAKDEAGLQAFYKKNKKKYTYDEPRFKGIAYFTREQSDIEAVKKSVKGKKFSDWAQILRNTFNNDSVLRIRVEKGIFKKGANGLVDRDIFGVADAKVKELSGFKYNATFGKVLKAPEEMADVRALVTADYQDAMEKEWVEMLRKRYTFTVDPEVLKTVK